MQKELNDLEITISEKTRSQDKIFDSVKAALTCIGIGMLGYALIGEAWHNNLKNETHHAKIELMQATATALAENPEGTYEDLKPYVYPTHLIEGNKEKMFCNATYLRSEAFDHDNEGATPSRTLAAFLTDTHCAKVGNNISIGADEKTAVTGTVVAVDVFNETPNNEDDYAQLILVEISDAQKFAQLTKYERQTSLHLKQPSRVPGISNIEICSYPTGIDGEMCQTTDIVGWGQGFRLAYPLQMTHSTSGSPFGKKEPDIYNIMGVMSQVYEEITDPYAFMAAVGPNANQRVLDIFPDPSPGGIPIGQELNTAP